jgi:hypothetical protein
MRATLDITDDVFYAAKQRARREKKTIGEVISDLAKTALSAPPVEPTARLENSTHGFRPFPKRGGVVTNELIDKLRGKLGI